PPGTPSTVYWAGLCRPRGCGSTVPPTATTWRTSSTSCRPRRALLSTFLDALHGRWATASD
ncbi:hypothetical protein, partial [Streptomyces sp. 1222.5]|uniref:hypothetical protein n=1 Tax=Streptomyces sp. 1222.5 TaxID=1881026 RepID=UPI003F49B49C